MVQLTLSLDARRLIMTESILFTAASVMQQLWLADAAGCCPQENSPNPTASLPGVALNLSFSHQLEPKWHSATLLLHGPALQKVAWFMFMKGERVHP